MSNDPSPSSYVPIDCDETARLEAIVACEQAILAHPEVLAAYWRLGLLHLLQGNEAEAQSVWLTAMLRLEADHEAEQLVALQHLLQTEAQQQLRRRPDLAEILCHQALEIWSDQPELYVLLGRAVALQGDLDGAIQWWQQAIDIHSSLAEANRVSPSWESTWTESTWAEPYRYQSQVWQKLGDYPQAIAAAQQAVNLAPDWQSYYCLGICFGYLQDWQTALPHFQQAVQLHPNCPMLHADLGWAWLCLKQPELAQQHLRVAVQQSNFAATYLAWIPSLPADRIDETIDENQALHTQLLQTLLLPTDELAAVCQFSAAVQAILQRQAIQTRPAPPSALPASVPADPTPLFATTQDWAATQPSDCYQALDPASTIPLLPPHTLDPEVHFSFRFGRAMPLPASFVAQIPAGRVWFAVDQSSTALFTADGHLLGDLSVEFPLLSPGHPDKHPSRHSARFCPLPPVKSVTATVAVLSGLTDNMYFHWMLDVLPRIDLLRRSRMDFEAIDYFLVSHHLPFQQETLQQLGIPTAKLLSLESALHLQATRLIVPSFPGVPAWMPRWACEFLRREFLPNRAAAANGPTCGPTSRKRLYLSRQSTANRRWINEADCWPVLERFGFQLVHLEMLSVAQQAALLAEAEVVLAIHGSGLTNIVFCQPGTKVVELFSPYYVYPCYWLLSNLMQLEYYYLLGSTPLGVFWHQLLYPNPRTEDVWIDPMQLETLLRLAM
ncbi:MAG: DUF563 domain-containing protein [Elainella sp. C42_A2020_010]|nr:DUF563 domain-containing protein [Elainella sp. C42_A2020_010]